MERKIKIKEIREAALDFVEKLSEDSQKKRSDLHFSEDNLVNWLVKFFITVSRKASAE